MFMRFAYQIELLYSWPKWKFAHQLFLLVLKCKNTFPREFHTNLLHFQGVNLDGNKSFGVILSGNSLAIQVSQNPHFKEFMYNLFKVFISVVVGFIDVTLQLYMAQVPMINWTLLLSVRKYLTNLTYIDMYYYFRSSCM